MWSQEILSTSTLDKNQVQEALITHINVQREQSNLKPLSPSSKLDALAKLQADYCVTKGKETHLQDSKKYRTIADRVDALDIENGTFQELITHVDLKKLKLKNNKELVEFIYSNLLKNKEYSICLISKTNIEIGSYISFIDEKLYLVVVVASKPVFTNNFKTPKNYYGIKTRSEDKNGVCPKCIQKLEAMPKDISYDLTIIDGTIYFAITNQEWFYKLFKHKMDGVAVDIVLKSQFPCENPNVETRSPVSNGYLLKPVFTKEMYKTASRNDRGNVFVPVGKVPEIWNEEEYELNVLILQSNILCQYGTFFQVPFDDWQMIDMPFDLNINAGKGDLEMSIQREMTFIVPFELGKSTFDAQDLKPLADSLKLARYNITHFDVVAYSSVEGSKKVNLELQQSRAQSIIKAIQSYQPQKIASKIQTAENWTEFYTDITTTSKAYLATKSEDEIRAYLNTNRIEEIDALLSKHRKAIIKVQLERKQLYTELDEQTIIKMLNDSSLNQGNDKYQLIDEVFLTEDPALLQFLNEKVKGNLTWSPEARAKITLSEYLLDSTQLEVCLDEMSGFIVEKNTSSMLQYNYYALKLLDWEKNLYKSDAPKVLKQQLYINKSIDPKSLNRLKLNYNILEAAEYTHSQKYELKKENVNQVIKLIPQMELSDEDKFRIAKFLASHHQYKVALDLLDSRTKVSDVHEDLLFLYINLSIIEDKVVQKADYRATLANAAVVNKERFCKLFDSSFKGGITFQLLQNVYLKRSYCEICE